MTEKTISVVLQPLRGLEGKLGQWSIAELRAAGYNDDEIELEMARRHKEHMDVRLNSAMLNSAPAVQKAFGIELCRADLRAVLENLRKRGGSFAAIGEAGLLVLRKSEDYNKSDLTGDAAGDDASKRDVYFPLGHASYAQMIHVKSQRILALVDAELKGRPVNFEGLHDSALDLINYASFLAERLARETSGPLS